MFYTPEKVLPLLDPLAGRLHDALAKGVAYADDLQPDRDEQDRWFWAHGARFKALRVLAESLVEVEGCKVLGNVPNCGIHLVINDLHSVRVVRSIGGTTPAPGRNSARRHAWYGVHGLQGQLALALDTNAELPPLSVIIDWHDAVDEPVVHVALPMRPWGYQKKPKLHWRVPFPGGGVDLATLRFDGSDDGGSIAEVTIDETELSGNAG